MFAHAPFLMASALSNRHRFGNIGLMNPYHRDESARRRLQVAALNAKPPLVSKTDGNKSTQIDQMKLQVWSVSLTTAWLNFNNGGKLPHCLLSATLMANAVTKHYNV